MTTRQQLRAIQETGILPGSYFPSRYYPKTMATEKPEQVITIFKEHVRQWAEWYPQDTDTPFYSNLLRIACLTIGSVGSND